MPLLGTEVLRDSTVKEHWADTRQSVSLCRGVLHYAIINNPVLSHNILQCYVLDTLPSTMGLLQRSPLTPVSYTILILNCTKPVGNSESDSNPEAIHQINK